MEVKRRPKETISMMMRRFSQKVRESGILVNAKKSRFQEKKISKNIRRRQALEKNKKRREKMRLKNLGRL